MAMCGGRQNPHMLWPALQWCCASSPADTLHVLFGVVKKTHIQAPEWSSSEELQELWGAVLVLSWGVRCPFRPILSSHIVNFTAVLILLFLIFILDYLENILRGQES